MAGRTVKLDVQKHRKFLAEMHAKVQAWPAWKRQAAASYLAPWPAEASSKQADAQESRPKAESLEA